MHQESVSSQFLGLVKEGHCSSGVREGLWKLVALSWSVKDLIDTMMTLGRIGSCLGSNKSGLASA